MKCRQVPSDYVPVDYTSKALQQTNVQLTWDQDDADRKRKLRRKLTGKTGPSLSTAFSQPSAGQPAIAVHAQTTR